ncbi:MAG: cation transporter [archaeon]|nr:cation transporter [archaeon]
MVLDKKEVNVVGMHCPSCAMAVELSMKDLDGVVDAKADLDTNSVEVEYDPEKVSDVDLAEAVKEAGFTME